MGIINFNYRKFRLPRRWSNAELRKLAPLFTGEVINVSGWDDRDKEGGFYRQYFSSATAYYISNFRGSRGLEDAADKTDFEIDLEKPLPPYLHNRFDVVFNHTTLEHIFDIFKAFENLCLMSRDVVLVVVPFTQQVHTSPSYSDYWRFTPYALDALFAKNQLTTVYRSANKHRNSSNYVIAVGAKNPSKWIPVMPESPRLTGLSDWIGNPFWI